MSHKTIIRNSIFSALGVVVYITIVACVMSRAPHWFGSTPGILGTVVFLTLFVLSAAILGLLIFAGPIHLYLTARRPEAFWSIGYTLAFIILIMICVIIFLSQRL